MEGDRHCSILASDRKNKKDQKKSSKQTSRWLPQTWGSQATNLMRHKNRQNWSKSTSHNPWLFELVQVNMNFSGSPLRWLRGQKNPKLLRIIKTIFSKRSSRRLTGSDCSKFLFCCLWFRPALLRQNILHILQFYLHKRHDSLSICYCKSFRKMVRTVLLNVID